MLQSVHTLILPRPSGIDLQLVLPEWLSHMQNARRIRISGADARIILKFVDWSALSEALAARGVCEITFTKWFNMRNVPMDLVRQLSVLSHPHVALFVQMDASEDASEDSIMRIM